MIEIPQASVARAIDVLRAGPMRADEFARRMWPERNARRAPGQQSRSGHPFLRQLAQVGYVQRVGDLWTLRTVGTAVGLDSAVGTAVVTPVPTAVGLGVGLPVGPSVGPAVGLGAAPQDGQLDRLPERLPNEPPRTEAEERADRDRLHRLVALATEPVLTVTHDRALGDVAIRGEPVGNCLAEACALVVLGGRTMNVYLPGEDADMLVALTPIEAARALYVRWAQSGIPPELPHYEGWVFDGDGPIALPCCWLPEYREFGIFFDDPEPLDQQILRQRRAAGLA